MQRTEASRRAGADWLEAGAVAVVLFVLYAATSPRTIALEDDGLFVLSSYFLGIEHPPGYPLFTLLGKLFTLLPFGSVAYRVHLLSATFGALTCGMIWLCARQLVPERLSAYVAALGLGLSRTFWSQAIIAEVYSLNTFFLFLLLYLVLRAQPQAAVPRWLLPAVAFLFGLSLTNHWPLMLLAAPGLAVLLWPRRAEFVPRLPVLLALFTLGLAPYAWMVVRSWQPLPISFYGPLESWTEFWFMLSRSGYAHVDVSSTATWLDRTRFFTFFGTELIAQFAVVGFALAAVGFWVQWRSLEKRVAWGLTLAFCGPSLLLLALLGFDYDAQHKHIFQVYPLPAYGVAALWMAIGTAWLIGRFRAFARFAVPGCVALLALIFAVSWSENHQAEHDWAARYADAFFETLPKDAIVIAMGDSDLVPLAYYHMIEGRRSDLTLLQPGGLILGNRQGHPLRASQEAMAEFVKGRLKEETGVVAATAFAQRMVEDLPRTDQWLFQVIDRKAAISGRSIAVPERLVQFFEKNVLEYRETNVWAASLQNELRRRFAALLAMQQQPGTAPDARTARHIEILSRDFFGAIGLLEGALSNERGYDVGQVIGLFDKVRQHMPHDASKRYQSHFFWLRAHMRQGRRDEAGAVGDLETAMSIWPVKENPVFELLLKEYAKTGRQSAAAELKARVRQ